MSADTQPGSQKQPELASVAPVDLQAAFARALSQEGPYYDPLQAEMTLAYTQWKISPSEGTTSGLREAIKHAVTETLESDNKRVGSKTDRQRNAILRYAANMAFALGDYGRGYRYDGREQYSVLGIARQIRNDRGEQSSTLESFSSRLIDNGQLGEATVLANAVENAKDQWRLFWRIGRAYAEKGDKMTAVRILQEARRRAMAQEPYFSSAEDRLDIYAAEGEVYLQLQDEPSKFIESVILDEVDSSHRYLSDENKVRLLTEASSALHRAGAASYTDMLVRAFNAANDIPVPDDRRNSLDTRRATAFHYVATTAQELGQDNLMQQIMTAGELRYHSMHTLQRHFINNALAEGNFDAAIDVLRQMKVDDSHNERASIISALAEAGQIERASSLLSAFDPQRSHATSAEIRALLAIAKAQQALGQDASQAVDRITSRISDARDSEKDTLIDSAIPGLVTLGAAALVETLIESGNAHKRPNLRASLAIALVRQGRVDDALKIAKEVTQRRQDTEHTDAWEVNFVAESQAYEQIILHLFRNGKDAEAIELLPSVRAFNATLSTVSQLADIAAVRPAA